MLTIHKLIEEYADHLATQINDGKPIDHVTYPPNSGFNQNEIEALTILQSNEHLKSAIRKVVADNIAGVVFDIFNIIDGTSDPETYIGKWTELRLVDKTKDYQPYKDMLHDKFFETYWDWRKMRPNNQWKLDIYLSLIHISEPTRPY